MTRNAVKGQIRSDSIPTSFVDALLWSGGPVVMVRRMCGFTNVHLVQSLQAHKYLSRTYSSRPSLNVSTEHPLLKQHTVEAHCWL